MKQFKRVISLLAVVLLSMSLVACGQKDIAKETKMEGDITTKETKTEGDKTKLTFQIWDINQKSGMEAMAAAYTVKNPNVEVEVQVTSWDEYWTKLEAAATGNTLPDVFWMHTNELLKYADTGMLANLTDLYKDESETFYVDHYSDVSLSNTKGTDGQMYAVPKDKDTVCLVYNKELFDQAGVTYPDENWTWDDLVAGSKKIFETTGKYGYMPYADDQLGYWNFVYQAGGYILNEDKTQAGYTDAATKKAMEFYINLQKEDFSPKQTYFAETAPGTAFFSGVGAMYLEGNWNLKANLDNFPEMVGKWDVAVLPKCPDPVNGDGRATISNGLGYATGAKGKNLEVAKEFIKFLGTEEAMKLQGESGAAIPAYEGLENTWVSVFDKYTYKLNVQKCVDMFAYGVQSINNASRPEWKSKVSDELLKIYSGESTIEEGLQKMQDAVTQASNKK